MITRMTSDINQVQTGVNLTLRLLLRSPFVVFGAMIMAFTVNTRAALVFVVIIPLLCLVVFGIMLINIPMYRRVQSALDRVLKGTRENLTGARVIRAFNRQAEETEEYYENTEALGKIQLLAGRLSALMNPVTYLIINFGIIILIRRGALQVNEGSITQGELTALINYMSQILVELVKMASLIISITKAWACGNRIQSVFDIVPQMSYGARTEDQIPQERKLCKQKKLPVMECIHAGITYRDAREESLSDVSFRAYSGDVIGIIGGTGSGKTTLVNLLARFYDATSGEVRLYGHPVSEYTNQALRSMIGIVPQKAVLFHGTIRDNLLWGKEDASQEEIMRALEISQSKEFVMDKPDGIDSIIEQEGRNLSGGQRQRLTIARTLIGEPDILILDDSSSALDYITDASLRQAVSKMEPAPVLFIISQRASSIMNADRILVLDDGQVAGSGTHSELLAQNEIYREICESQFPKGGAGCA